MGEREGTMAGDPRRQFNETGRRVLAMAAGVVLAIAGAMGASLSACGAIGRMTEPPPKPFRAFTSEPDIRVRIKSNVASVKVTATPMLVVRPIDKGPTQGQPITIPGPITITSSRNGLSILDGRGQRHAWSKGDNAEVLASDQTGTASITVDGVMYPGFVSILGRWSGDATKLDVVVDMPIEAYVPGVLTHELLKDWPRQTYECQAVVARTYAVHERERSRRAGRGWDVEDTTADQVFGGLTKLRVPQEATRATRGMIIAWRGDVLRAYYSSTCGGRAGSAAEVWTTAQDFEFNKAEPIQGKPREHYCHKATRYRWEISRTDEDISQRLRAYGRMRNMDFARLGRIRQITVNERNDAQRPTNYRVIDDRGDAYVVKAEDVRAGLNHTVQGLDPVVRDKNMVLSGDFEVDIWATTVKIRGRGWGHGVGMCQWCAKGMADAGKDWAEMVKTFYPGAEVVKGW